MGSGCECLCVEVKTGRYGTRRKLDEIVQKRRVQNTDTPIQIYAHTFIYTNTHIYIEICMYIYNIT